MNARLLLVLLATLIVTGAVDAQDPLPLGPMPEPAENPVTPEKALLGKFLFWEEQLSSDDAVACGTCHLPFAGGSDFRSVRSFSVHPGADSTFGTDDDVAGSVGVIRQDCDGNLIDDGVFFPDRQVTGRRTPSFIGIGYAAETFWDGRAGETFVDPLTGVTEIQTGGALENQAIGPPLSDVEMACEARAWESILEKLEDVTPMALAEELPGDMISALGVFPTYPDLFFNAYADTEITVTKIAFAIASYERTLVPDQTPYDLFLGGDTNALTINQQQGLDLFREHCVVCHTEPLLSDNLFHNTGIRPPEEDIGRMEVTGDPLDEASFKTPPLRNVALRAPFFHNGGKADLQEVMILYNTGGDFGPAEGNPQLDVEMVELNLTNGELAQIIDFLEGGLTDPRVEDELFPFSRPTLRPYFRRGDSNTDDMFGLDDPIHALDYMFLGGGPLLCEDATDANDNGIIDLGDPILMLNRMFLNGAPLPSPSDQNVGPDPTTDLLDCRP